MLACLRPLAAALLAVASLTSALTPVVAGVVPPVRAGCAGTGHNHETPPGTPAVHAGSPGCDQCERGCTGPGQCVTSASLAVLEAAAPNPVRRAHLIRYDTLSQPLSSTGAAPPIPPPQPTL